MCFHNRKTALDETAPLTPTRSIASPPTGPRFVVNYRELPRAARIAIHDENIARANAYARDYRAYLERYCALVDDSRSLEEVRAIGDAVLPLLPSCEPGLDLDGDEDLMLDFRKRVARVDDRVALRAVHEKTFALRLS